jgi:4-hydroxybenzoate polyprenyltransferase
MSIPEHDIESTHRELVRRRRMTVMLKMLAAVFIGTGIFHLLHPDPKGSVLGCSLGLIFSYIGLGSSYYNSKQRTPLVVLLLGLSLILFFPPYAGGTYLVTVGLMIVVQLTGRK